MLQLLATQSSTSFSVIEAILPILVIILIFSALHGITSFFMPFYIRSIKNSQKDIDYMERTRLNLEKQRLELEKQRLNVEKQLLALERSKTEKTEV